MNKEITLYREMTDKIKLDKLYTTLNITPTIPQLEAIDIVDNQKDVWFSTVVQGRRSGKSFSASMEIVRELLVPYASVKILSPVSKILSVLWKEVVQRLNELGVKPVRINTNDKYLELENGSVLFGAAETNKETVLGTRSSLIVVDEAAIFEDLKSFMELQLLPTLMDYGVRDNGTSYGRVKLISTPRGKANYFYQTFVKGELKTKGHRSLQYPSSVNPLVTEEYLEAMKEACSELVYLQEYEAQFVSITNDTVFYGFDLNKHIKPTSDFRTFINSHNTYVGLDIGFKDSSAHLMVMADPSGYYVFSAEMLAQASTAQLAEKFKSKEEEFGVIPQARYIDPSAALTSHDLSSIYSYYTFPAQNSVRESISLLNQLFEENRLYIAKECQDLVEQIVAVEWNQSKSGKDPFKKHPEHHFDLIAALRYAIYSHFKQYVGQEVIAL